MPHLTKGSRSEGVRIIEEKWTSGCYRVTLEGRSGEEYLLDFFDPSHSVKRVEGAVALARVDGRLTVAVRLPEEEAASHVKREISLTT
jgi:hypothetical protein